MNGFSPGWLSPARHKNSGNYWSKVGSFAAASIFVALVQGSENGQLHVITSHTFMSQLAVGEFRSSFNAGQDFPTYTTDMVILKFGKVVSEFLAHLHLEISAGLVRIGKPLIVLVSVFLVRIVRCFRPRGFCWWIAATARFSAEFKYTLNSGVVRSYRGPALPGALRTQYRWWGWLYPPDIRIARKVCGGD